MSDPFASQHPDDVRRLIADHPLAWMFVPGRPDVLPMALPLIGEYGGDGGLVALIGHFGRNQPMHAAVRTAGAARFLFRGPQAYVSPDHAGVRDWGPTWNYAQLVVDAAVRVDEALTGPALDVLVAAMEAGRARPWTSTELGARDDGLAARIIGFRAAVTAVAGRFKLGQDERPEVRDAILARHPDATLTDWMRTAAAVPRGD